MDPTVIKNCIDMSKKLYMFINKINNLKYDYIELGNDLIIIIELFLEVKNSKRLLECNNIKNTIELIEESLQKLDENIRQSVNMNIKKKVLKVLKNDTNDKKQQLNTLINRLKLLLDISKEKKDKSRLDIVNILKEPLLVQFWETNFGSENNNISYDLFIQCMQDELGTKLITQHIKILKKLIDFDDNNNISVYEFNLWIKRFGPIQKSFSNTFDSLYDTRTDSIYEWYFGDTLYDKIKVFLEDKGFGTTIIRNNFVQINSNDNVLFYLTFVGWSFSDDNIELFDMPIKKINEKIFIDYSYAVSSTDEGKEFLNYFRHKLDNNNNMSYDNLKLLYEDFQKTLRSFAKTFGLIYYSHFEVAPSYYNFILGELINICNKGISKFKRLKKINQEPSVIYTCCYNR